MEAKPSSGKVGACVNCGREKYIADKEGLCATCHHAVKGINKDSVTYTAALADVKKRLINNPSRRGTVKRSKATALPVKSAKQEAKTITHRGINPITKALEDVRIPDDLILSHDDIIKTLKAQRDFHLTQMEKYIKAINLLS